MSKMVVTSFMTFRSQPPDEVVSVPIPGRRLPPGRFIGWYGNKEIREQIRVAIDRARADGRIFRQVDIHVEVGRISVRQVSRKRLREDRVKVVDLNRIHNDLAQDILEIIRRPGDPRDVVEIIASVPSRLNRLWEDRRFSFVRLFLWPDRTTPDQRVRYGAIRSPRDVCQVVVRNHDGPVPGVRF